MKMSRLAVVFPAALLLAGGTAHADPLRADHPLIGSWKMEIPKPKCTETYRIRKDGTALITSADEIAETTFTISDKPSAKGFYKWVDRVVKDNGKKDCSGATTQVGQ